MNLEDLRVYNQAMDMGERVWALVDRWNYFQKDTIGKQLVRAVDSIAANLSEGFGRYHFKETKNFGYYSRGSLFETKTWLTKAYSRKLIGPSEFMFLISEIEIIGKMLNKYIKAVGNYVQEPEIIYGSGSPLSNDESSAKNIDNNQFPVSDNPSPKN
jgi:four helix bundle protein